MTDPILRVDTIVDLLSSRAETEPGRIGYIHLKDGKSDEETISYGELHRRSLAVATMLQTRVGVGERVLICHNPGIDYLVSFFGSLYAGAIAVPVYPPRFSQKLERLVHVVEDASPRIALGSQAILSNLQSVHSESAAVRALDWVDTTESLCPRPEEWRRPALDPQTVAFLQYTSGSIASPKGVVLTHANLLANLDSIREMFEAHENSRAVSWLPQYHDMGLIGMMLGSLYTRVPVAFMSPFAFVQKPARWLQAISRFRATISGAPSFAYDLCVRRVTDEQLEGVDLSCWENAFCGAEPISYSALTAFAERFRPFGFRAESFHPCYGMAEATLAISGGLRKTPPLAVAVATDPGARKYVGCGKAAALHEIRIVDPQTGELRDDGEVGEVWFAGPSVASGYWDRPAETAGTFLGRPAVGGRPGVHYLRTGDLGFVRSGELFVTGRIKEVMILLGRNIYPQDVEQTARLAHPSLVAGSAAAFSVALPEGERLAIVHEIARSCRAEELPEIAGRIRDFIVEDHGVRPVAVSLVKANSIPTTSSGKTQRLQAQALFLQEKLPELFRWDERMR